MLLTDTRTDLADTLATAMPDITVYPVTPDTPIPPCVAVAHGTPWVVPLTIGRAWTVNYRLICTVRATSNHIPALEDLVERTLDAVPDGWVIDDVTPPAQYDTGAQGVVYACDVRVHGTFTEN